jgi:hypothetical protein
MTVRDGLRPPVSMQLMYAFETPRDATSRSDRQRSVRSRRTADRPSLPPTHPYQAGLPASTPQHGDRAIIVGWLSLTSLLANCHLKSGLHFHGGGRRLHARIEGPARRCLLDALHGRW